jgi:hypothetical protein
MEAELCSCDFDYDGVVAEFHNERIHTAKKKHRCIECDEEIQVGDTYHYVVQKAEGHIYQMHICVLCERIRSNFCAPYYMLRDTISENLGFDYVTGEWNELPT